MNYVAAACSALRRATKSSEGSRRPDASRLVLKAAPDDERRPIPKSASAASPADLMGSPDSSKRGAYAAPASASKPNPSLDFLFFFQRILILSWESCSESCEPGCHHWRGETFRYSRLFRSRHASLQLRPHIRTHFGATTMFKARLISTWAPQGLKRQFSNLFNDRRHFPPFAQGVLGSRTNCNDPQIPNLWQKFA